MYTHSSVDIKPRPHIIIVFFLCCICCIVIAILPVTSIGAEIYKWRDQQGNLHFSDSPPIDLKLASQITRTSVETIPFLDEGNRNNSLVYQNSCFTLVLAKETPDSLTFELTYNDIDKQFPQVFDKTSTLMIASLTDPLSPTYLSYTTHKVKNNNATVAFINQTTERSPNNLKTSFLSLYLYQNIPGEPRGISLFSKQFPFPKTWGRASNVQP